MAAYLNVLSGISQGSVLGPILFIIYVNDLPGVVESLTMLFADDTKLYRPVNDIEDREKLQGDINSLMRWS